MRRRYDVSYRSATGRHDPVSNGPPRPGQQRAATTNEMNRGVRGAAAGTGEVARNITGVAGAAQITSQVRAQRDIAAGPPDRPP